MARDGRHVPYLRSFYTHMLKSYLFSGWASPDSVLRIFRFPQVAEGAHRRLRQARLTELVLVRARCCDEALDDASVIS